jgi:predicted DCC family thiol-disulfide oxidoreductase YuxK
MQPSVILFDGVCNLCNASVQFIIKHDPQAQYQFASLQSNTGQRMLHDYGINPRDESVILVENGHAYMHSSAALRIARRLSGGWSVVYAFIVVPRFIRDAMYRFIARNRYRWFGRRDACMIPTPALRRRFLD